MILAALIPKIYELTNTYWIGQISYNALATTEQHEFLGVTVEIVNEMIPFRSLALVAQNFTNKEKNSLHPKAPMRVPKFVLVGNFRF